MVQCNQIRTKYSFDRILLVILILSCTGCTQITQQDKLELLRPTPSSINSKYYKKAEILLQKFNSTCAELKFQGSINLNNGTYMDCKDLSSFKSSLDRFLSGESNSIFIKVFK